MVDTDNSQIPSIDVRGLSKRYGPVAAVQGVSFTVHKGEVVGFLGPNGAGKSTTMRILSGLASADCGEAYLCGESVALHPERAKLRIGYMPENNPLPEDMRVVEYLRFRAQLKGVARSKQTERINTVMELCDLQRKARRKLIGALSKGFKQRVGIADALLAEPDIVIMDEPTIGLDPHQIQAMRELISNLRGKMTVVLSSHILPEIEACCDRVIIINQGEVVASGDTDSLRREFISKRTFMAELAGDVEQITDALKALAGVEALNVHRTSGDFHKYSIVTALDGIEGEDLIAGIKALPDARLRSLSPVVSTLEDVFMAATRRSWDEVSEPLEPTASPKPSVPETVS